MGGYKVIEIHLYISVVPPSATGQLQANPHVAGLKLRSPPQWW